MMSCGDIQDLGFGFADNNEVVDNGQYSLHSFLCFLCFLGFTKAGLRASVDTLPFKEHKLHPNLQF